MTITESELDIMRRAIEKMPDNSEREELASLVDRLEMHQPITPEYMKQFHSELFKEFYYYVCGTFNHVPTFHEFGGVSTSILSDFLTVFNSSK